MKVTLHGGQGSAKHNDHNSTKRDNGHIDYSKTANNFKWTCMDTKDCKYSIEDGENRFYDEFFGETLRKMNEKYIKKGQYGRVRDMREWQNATRHKPREVILQIGDKDNHPSDDIVFKASRNFLRWKKERFKDNLKIISSTMHVDESTPHLHIREVWFYRDADGLPQTGIKDALREAGVELPNPNEPESKTNYRMATVDAECREKWQEICKSYGLQIETEIDEERKQSNVGHMGVDAWNEYQQAMSQAEDFMISCAEECAQEKDEAELERRANDEILASERADLYLEFEERVSTEVERREARRRSAERVSADVRTTSNRRLPTLEY